MAERDYSNITEHLKILAADGTHVGTVDHLDGDRIKRKRVLQTAAYAA